MIFLEDKKNMIFLENKKNMIFLENKVPQKKNIYIYIYISY